MPGARIPPPTVQLGHVTPQSAAELFSMALVLIQPDPSRQFEVDASEVRAVFSQYSVPENGLIHVPFTLIGAHLQSPMMM